VIPRRLRRFNPTAADEHRRAAFLELPLDDERNYNK
jgi:hypothetical protein